MLTLIKRIWRTNLSTLLRPGGVANQRKGQRRRKMKEYQIPERAMARAPVKRLKSKHEIIRQTVAKGKSGRKTCGFCRMPGHTQPSCQVRSAIGINVNGKSTNAFTMGLLKLEGKEISFDGTVQQQLTAVPKSTKSLCVHGVFRDKSTGTVVVRSSLYGDGGTILSEQYVVGQTLIKIDQLITLSRTFNVFIEFLCYGGQERFCLGRIKGNANQRKGGSEGYQVLVRLCSVIVGAGMKGRSNESCHTGQMSHTGLTLADGLRRTRFSEHRKEAS
mmetsp:Transcript_5387/g.15203  ORF Transcript_5387/g.15203 Transcript_5387/m.15203 type:complete len:274 (+) Transcript_5387:397-1218(+)